MSIYCKEKPEFLKMSVESMLQQTVPPDQIVIVKDGKLTSELDKVIDNYKKRYPEIFTVVSLEKNVGLGAALNEGLKQCRNELIARMDTDDISVKDRCELQLKEFMKNNNLSIVGGMIDEFYGSPDNIITSRVVPLKHDDILKFSRRRNPFNHPTVMYKRSAVLECGGYSNYRKCQDFDLFVRMLHKGYKGLNIDRSLVLFRVDKDYLKRRKSWEKCKYNIIILYKFWREGYSSFIDLIIVSLSQLFILIMPLRLVKWIYEKFLRQKLKKDKGVEVYES